MNNILFLIFYAVSASIMSMLNATGTLSFGMFWRYTILLIMLFTETYLLFTADAFMIFGLDFGGGGWTRHNYITLLHDIGISLFIAMSQV
jgi:hypothetical protein